MYNLRSLNPFGYTRGQLKVALVQLVATAVILVGFFTTLNPDTTAAWQALVIAVFGTVGVFTAKNPDATSFNKSLTSLLTSVVGVINLYSTVPTSTVQKIETLIAVLIVPVLVLVLQNEPLPLNPADGEPGSVAATSGS